MHTLISQVSGKTVNYGDYQNNLKTFDSEVSYTDTIRNKGMVT